MRMVLLVDFFLMDYKSPYNAILGTDYTIPTDVVAFTRYQIIKLSLGGQITKVRSN